MPVVIKVDGEPVLRKLTLQARLEVDPEAMHERQLMRLKSKQNPILVYDVAERGGHGFQDGLSS